MMTNLFSIFDPISSSNLSLNWISLIIPVMLMPMMYWMLPSRFQLIFFKLMKLFMKENKMIITHHNINSMIFLSIFILILMNNFMGLFPYIFTSTSHMNMTLSISLSIWISFMLYGWLNNYNNMLIHLVPMTTPYILMPLMVMIETISNIIRPITLAIRLSANMISGHLLLSLLGSSMQNMSPIILLMMIFIQILLMILEMSVSIIQSYVFSTLSTLYSNESY
uniref:ATP synthase subunit a n=1 Tax=Cleptes metallicorpus TaxID=2491147 RepID=A0A3S8V0D8_9HYME|nr:ATP synthase F0 subunit 6 [Cleptes metallicorpus]